MNKKTFANLMSLEKKAFEKNVAKFRKLNQSCNRRNTSVSTDSEDDGNLQWEERAVTPELLIEMQRFDSKTKVAKGTFANQFSIEKKAYGRNVAKFRKLNQSGKQYTTRKRAASEDEDDPVLEERALTPELLIEMHRVNSKTMVDKRTFANPMGIDKKPYEKNVSKFRKLNQSGNQRPTRKRAASDDEDDPLLEEEAPEFLIKTESVDSNTTVDNRTFGNLVSLEKKTYEKNVAKFRKPNQSRNQRTTKKTATSENEGNPLLEERAVTPELLIAMQCDDSNTKVAKDTFANQMSLERKAYEKYVAKCRKLNQSGNHCNTRTRAASEEEDDPLLDEGEIQEVDSNTGIDKHTADDDVITILKKILDKQNHLEARMIKLETTIDDLVTSCKENKRSKAEDMARDEVMRECKVLTKKIHNSICQLTGDEENEPQIDISSSLPITSLEAAKDIDEKLQDKEYHQAMKLYLKKLTGAALDFETILRKLYTDEFLWDVNWEGIKGKLSLMQFSLAAELLCECTDFLDRGAYESAMRKCISKSHNRISQKRYLDRQSLEKGKLQ